MSARIVLAACLALGAPAASAATITIVNQDAAGEGFNDPTIVVPEGGNLGTTLGQQRLNVFNAAAAVWGNALVSNQTIKVAAQFNPLSCSQFSGVLGSAGPTNFFVLNDGAGNRFFPVALAEALGMTNLNGASNEISSQYNSSIDDNNPNCLGNTRWYYGLTGPEPSGTIALFPTVLHELGHGLGFLTLLCEDEGGCNPEAQGGYFSGIPDVWADFLRDNNSDGAGTNKLWVNMTDAERAASFTNDPFLVWDGPMVTAQLATFGQTGTSVNEGRMRMFAPDPYDGGSSLSHFHEDASPNLLMEPIADDDVFNQTDLTLALFQDIGWQMMGGPVPNQAPSITRPASIAVTEDMASALTGIVFADADAGAGSVTATFSVPGGTVNATSGGGVTAGGTATARTLAGTITAINAFVSGGSLTYTTAQNATANVTLTILINDNGNTGSGGAMTDTDTSTLTVTAVNDAPTIAVASSLPINPTGSRTLSALATLGDVDVASASMTLTLAVADGTLTSVTGGGVTVAGSGTATITLTGTLANLNTRIAGANVTFNQDGSPSTTVNLTQTINDNGNTGSGGARTANGVTTLSANDIFADGFE